MTLLKRFDSREPGAFEVPSAAGITVNITMLYSRCFLLGVVIKLLQVVQTGTCISGSIKGFGSSSDWSVLLSLMITGATGLQVPPFTEEPISIKTNKRTTVQHVYFG